MSNVAQVDPSLEPLGTPVAQTFDVQSHPPVKSAVEEALAAIAQVHGDGNHPPIPVHDAAMGAGVRASYDPQPTKTIPHGVRMDPNSKYPALDFVHEVGHSIDHRSFGQRGQYGTEGGTTQFFDLLDLLQNTPTFQRLKALEKKGGTIEVPDDRPWMAKRGKMMRVRVDVRQLRYLQKRSELFGRAYAQWVAIRSGNTRLLNELNRRQADPSQQYYPEHWDDAEFAKVAEEFDRVFMNLGWMKRK